jgi:hypothetical protein
MKKQIIFFLTFVSSIFTASHCFAMENENNTKIIPLDNGLCTIIPGILSKTGYKNSLLKKRTIYETSKKEDSLLNLIDYKKSVDYNFLATLTLTTYTHTDNVELFCPYVFKKLPSNKSCDVFERLGQFNKEEHHEAVEAIFARKAIYYAQEQGALIYSLDEKPQINSYLLINLVLNDVKNDHIEIPKYLFK